MVVSFEYELASFFISVVLAVFVGTIYDFFRALRRVLKMTIFCDIIMWMAMLFVIVSIWFFMLNGEVRWYTVLGAFLTGIIYFFSLSQYVYFLFRFIVGKIYAFFCIILKILLTPPCFLCRIIGVYISKTRMKFFRKVEEINDEKNV